MIEEMWSIEFFITEYRIKWKNNKKWRNYCTTTFLTSNYYISLNNKSDKSRQYLYTHLWKSYYVSKYLLNHRISSREKIDKRKCAEQNKNVNDSAKFFQLFVAFIQYMNITFLLLVLETLQLRSRYYFNFAY